MGFPGQIAQGANDELAELFRRQMVEAQQQEQQRQFNARLLQDRAEMAQRGRIADTELNQRQQQITGQEEERGRAARERNNETGVRQMIGSFLTQRQGPITGEDRRSVAALQAESGGNIDPRLLAEPERERDPLADYEAKKKLDLKYRVPSTEKPERDPIADYEAKKGIDAKYDAQARAARVDKPNTYAIDASSRVVSKVDAIMPRINNWTAGVPGKAIASLPINSEARDVAAEIESLTATIGFDELQKMRAASPTGGALGQISDAENKLLANVVASVRQDQSPPNLKKNLAIVRESAARILAAAQKDAGTSAAVGNIRPMSSRDSGAAPAATGGAQFRFNPATGKVEPVK
jgi:hypothetical protein